MRATKHLASLLASLAAAILISALISTIGAAPARAGTVERTDPSGDAAARYDIVGVTYANTPAAFRYRMEFRDLRARAGILAFPKLLVNGTWDRFFQVDVGVRRDGNRFHRLIINTPRRYGTVRCPGLTSTVDLDADVVTARVPQACLTRAGFGHRRYLVHGYAATPGMSEAGDTVPGRWVPYD